MFAGQARRRVPAAFDARECCRVGGGSGATGVDDESADVSDGEGCDDDERDDDER